MNSEYLLIGETAELFDVSRKTLRYYEKIGLISPERSENGYRVYGVGDLLKMQRVKRLQDLGLTLRQIKEILDGDGESQWQELLYSLLDNIDDQITTLEGRRSQIERMLDQGVEEALADEALELPDGVQAIQMQMGGIDIGQLAEERRFYALVMSVSGVMEGSFTSAYPPKQPALSSELVPQTALLVVVAVPYSTE